MFAVEYMILVFSLLLAGGLLLTLARMGAAGTLSRNRVIGIRTGATMQSDATATTAANAANEAHQRVKEDSQA